MSERIQLKAGDAAPAFSAPGLDGEPVTLESFAGRGLVLYFYPKDNTAGCTLEAQGFRDHLADFEALGYAVAGVSRDSVKSHCGFRDRQNLNFPLLADKEEVVCTAYGVMKEKMMYGRLCRGIERSTFVISPEGRILHALYGVKAKTHVEELLALLKDGRPLTTGGTACASCRSCTEHSLARPERLAFRRMSCLFGNGPF